MAIQITVKGLGAEPVAKFIAYRLGAVGSPNMVVDIPQDGVSALPAITRQISKVFEADARVRIAVVSTPPDWTLADEIRADRRARGKKL